MSLDSSTWQFALLALVCAGLVWGLGIFERKAAASSSRWARTYRQAGAVSMMIPNFNW